MSSSFLFVMADALDDPERRAEALFVLWSYFKSVSDGVPVQRWLKVSEDDHGALAVQVHQQLQRIGERNLDRHDHRDLATDLSKFVIVAVGPENVLEATVFAERLSLLRVVRRNGMVGQLAFTPSGEHSPGADADGCLAWGKHFIRLSEESANIAGDLESARILLEKARDIYGSLESRNAIGICQIHLARVYWIQGGERSHKAVDMVEALTRNEHLMISEDDDRELLFLHHEMSRAGFFQEEE